MSANEVAPPLPKCCVPSRSLAACLRLRLQNSMISRRPAPCKPSPFHHLRGGGGLKSQVLSLESKSKSLAIAPPLSAKRSSQSVSLSQIDRLDSARLTTHNTYEAQAAQLPPIESHRPLSLRFTRAHVRFDAPACALAGHEPHEPHDAHNELPRLQHMQHTRPHTSPHSLAHAAHHLSPAGALLHRSNA